MLDELIQYLGAHPGIMTAIAVTALLAVVGLWYVVSHHLQAIMITLLTAAGIRNVQVKSMSRTMRFADGAVFVRLNGMALINMSAAGKTMTESERARILGEIEKESVAVAAPYTDGNGLAFELKANVAIGRG